MDTVVVKEVNILTRSVRYSREAKLMGETSVRSGDREKKETSEKKDRRSKLNCNTFNGYARSATIHVLVAPV